MPKFHYNNLYEYWHLLPYASPQNVGLYVLPDTTEKSNDGSDGHTASRKYLRWHISVNESAVDVRQGYEIGQAHTFHRDHACI